MGQACTGLLAKCIRIHSRRHYVFLQDMRNTKPNFPINWQEIFAHLSFMREDDCALVARVPNFSLDIIKYTSTAPESAHTAAACLRLRGNPRAFPPC